MRIDFTGLKFLSSIPSFQEYDKVSFSVSVPGQNLTAGSFVSYTASTPLNNANAVTNIQIQYNGLDSFWRYVPGRVYAGYPDYDFGTRKYEVGSYTYYNGSNLNVFTYIVNQTGGTVAIPAFSVDIVAFLYLAPF